jgi:hypothetical protein
MWQAAGQQPGLKISRATGSPNLRDNVHQAIAAPSLW